MATRPALPYFAPPDQLPAPLPTVAEILASTQWMTRWTGEPLPHVVRVGEHFVAKFGPGIRLREGENMLFVQQSTSILVPTVYALFHDDATGNNFIIMEYVPGQGLDKYWKTADHSGKEAVVKQLRRYFDELRSIPSPGYFGGLWRQPILDLTATGFNEALEKGDVLPCETQEQYIDITLQNANARFPKKNRWHLEFRKHMFHSVFRGRDSVFTHGDCHPSNFFVRHDNTMVLIDWQWASWCPSYAEYCSAMTSCDEETDWALWIPRFLDEHIAELGWMFHLLAWLRYDGF
ncbi:hypothetical protein AYL99_06485 [Fonsecaea erecta]|uniref:Aminoglycoside phosphotransferase domain-containing protein n=1 Tax=Fonsecaea erecta TaxID=1367422 RepID=A0A178ZHA6_9EURO|nr:hypothetical protein AYL99_06485 [Fonsecaea erecta]OAP59187.1 hypothetical protein AYL99_06485 [Fonsecaea erecta]